MSNLVDRVRRKKDGYLFPAMPALVKRASEFEVVQVPLDAVWIVGGVILNAAKQPLQPPRKPRKSRAKPAAPPVPETELSDLEAGLGDEHGE